MTERILAVLEICLPVFAFIGFGKVLSWRGVVGEKEHNLLNWIVYYVALPALIFGAVSRQAPGDFLHAPFWVSSLVPVFVAAILFVGLARFLRIRGATAAAFVFGCFWANTAYMGLPLAERAFGTRGLELAAVYNAVFMPLFIVLGFLLIGLYTGGNGESVGHRLKRAFVNPIVGSALLGLLAAFIGEAGYHGEHRELPALAASLVRIGYAVVDLAGQMGLPLALILIGASLRVKALKGHGMALVLAVVGKLVLVPGLALLCLQWLYPDLGGVNGGTVVLLSGMPNAVASYVVAKRMDVDEPFVASLLVVSTVFSVITIPLWLYFVL